jgi:hypothetical protein
MCRLYCYYTSELFYENARANDNLQFCRIILCLPHKIETVIYRMQVLSNKGTNDESKLSDITILEIDGGVITGLLVFLTLSSSFIPFVTGAFGNVILITMTAGVIIPFGMSALMVLSKYISSPRRKVLWIIVTTRDYSKYAGNWAFWGFLYLIGVMIVLLVINSLSAVINFLSPEIPTLSPLQEACQESPETFGIKKDLCAKIEPGSIYEECVMNTVPNVNQCSEFIT